MKKVSRVLVSGLVLGLSASGAQAQQVGIVTEPQATATFVGQAGQATSFSFETRVVRDAPYSGEAVNEFVQELPDGNRIVRRTTTRVARDAEGRTRRETLGANGEVTQITISDPVAGVSFVLDPASRTASKAPAMFARVATTGTGAVAVGSGVRIMRVDPSSTNAAVSPERRKEIEAAAQKALAEGGVSVAGFSFTTGTRAGEAAREDLGEQTIEGVTAKGTRTTTTIAAGAVGNEQPIQVVSEQWTANDLQVLMLTRHADPRSGETVYRLTNVVRTAPDRSLFVVPDDYTVKDGARRPFMFQQQ